MQYHTIPDPQWEKTFKLSTMASAFHGSYLEALRKSRHPGTDKRLLDLIDSASPSQRFDHPRYRLFGNLVISDYLKKSEDYIVTEDRLGPFETLCDQITVEVGDIVFTQACETLKEALREHSAPLSINTIGVSSDEDERIFNDKSLALGNILFLLQFGAPGWHQEAGHSAYGN